ncbi:MAG: aspartyl/asparaginyl beta-hydroxylase domain-containing protein [Bacteroidota bacterium]
MKQPELWFCDYNKKYEGPEPYFFPEREIEVAQFLEHNHQALQNELKVLWEYNSVNAADAFGNYDSFDDKQFPPRSWQKMVFKVWGLKNKRNCDRFPITASIIKKFPAVSSCFVTKTSPGSVIKPHCGETNAHLRIHLGLHVPEVASSVCGMEVGNETTGWQSGKTFAFLDGHHHHVWNNSDADRYVLIVDLIRPEFASRRNFIYARVIVSQMFFYFTSLMKISKLHLVPSTFLDIVTYVLYLPVQLMIQLNNRIGFIKL